VTPALLVGLQMHAQAVALIWLSAPVVALTAALGGVIFVDSGSIEPAKALVVALVALSLPGALITSASGNQSYSERGARSGGAHHRTAERAAAAAVQ
jgi:ATP-binding cassette subfamily B protein